MISSNWEIPFTPENTKPLTDENQDITLNSEKVQEEILDTLISKDKDVLDPDKEIIEQLPELEEENFRVESAKRKEIKDQDWIKVKVNPQWDIREYNWQQLFTKESAIRETNKAGRKLPPSSAIYEDMIAKKYAGNYQDFLRWEKMLFSGWYGAKSKCLLHANESFGMRCTDGSAFKGLRDAHYLVGKWYNAGCGFSVRCIKE